MSRTANCDRQASDEAPVVFRVRVVPRASRSEILGSEGGTLRVRVSAPPVEGKANKELVKLLAKALAVGSGQVELVSGHKARLKTVRIHGVDRESVSNLMRTGKTPGDRQ